MACWVRKAGLHLLASSAHPKQVGCFLEMDQKPSFDPHLPELERNQNFGSSHP